MANQAQIIAGYSSLLLTPRENEIRSLHTALDVDHTHIYVGQDNRWNDLPQVFKNKFRDGMLELSSS